MARACVSQKNNLKNTLGNGLEASRRFAIQTRVFTLDSCVSLGSISSRPKTLHYNPRTKYKAQKKTQTISPIIQGQKKTPILLNLLYKTQEENFILLDP